MLSLDSNQLPTCVLMCHQILFVANQFPTILKPHQCIFTILRERITYKNYLPLFLPTKEDEYLNSLVLFSHQITNCYLIAFSHTKFYSMNMHQYLLDSQKFRMVKRNFIEVAPSMVISPQRKPNFSKLETIVEEGPQRYDVVVPKRLFIALPVLLSMIMYFFIYQSVV